MLLSASLSKAVLTGWTNLSTWKREALGGRIITFLPLLSLSPDLWQPSLSFQFHIWNLTCYCAINYCVYPTTVNLSLFLNLKLGIKLLLRKFCARWKFRKQKLHKDWEINLIIFNSYIYKDKSLKFSLLFSLLVPKLTWMASGKLKSHIML